MELHPEEPAAVGWAHVTDDELRERVLALLPPGQAVVLVDGRSAGGKTTFAARLAGLLGAGVVHIDDFSWYVDPTGWEELVVQHALEPWRRGDGIDYRPPVWQERGRLGAIVVPAGRVLVVEGVGAGRAALAAHADAVVWVQSDRVEARRRGLLRDAELGRPEQECEPFWDEWMRSEEPLLAAEKPWERADLVVCGTPELVDPRWSGAGTLVGRMPPR